MQGISSPTNKPPALYEPCEWTDLNGNFWLYGGVDSAACTRNDLWKYNPLINEWTWVTGTNTLNDPGIHGIQGVPSPSNRPPAMAWGTASWVDLNGNLWMFGGSYISNFNDLWKYEIGANEWTWMKGPGIANQTGVYGIKGVPDINNNPGARSECAAAWVDNTGDLWMFGGYNGTNFNDLWRFNIATNTWTWMKGSNLTNQNGIFGTLGVEDSLNTPGSRFSFCHWKDNIGNLWLFAGSEGPLMEILSDLWRFNILTNNWTWMGGSNVVQPVGPHPGHYGNKCLFSSLNFPGYRTENRAAWTDSDGNFWLFGGTDHDAGPANLFANNDLWKYCVSTNQWAWINGDSVGAFAGNWGAYGISNSANQPHGRVGAVGWSGNNNQLYLFGGMVQVSPSSYNDLWKYTIDTTCAHCNSIAVPPIASFIITDSSVCSGDCVNFSNNSNHATSYQWLFPGGTPSSDISPSPQGICYYNSGVFDVTLIATNSSGSDTLTLSNYLTIYPQIQFSPLTQNFDTLFSLPGYVSYEWYDNMTLIPGANNYYYIAVHSGNYGVVVSDSNGCSASAYLTNVIASANEVKSQNEFNVSYFSGRILIELFSPFTAISSIQLTDAIGKEIYNKYVLVTMGKNEIEIPAFNISTGIYFIGMNNLKQVYKGRIFIK